MEVSGKHIGDGIYLDDQGHQIRVSTPRMTGVHEIFFGPGELWGALLWCIHNNWLTREGLEVLLEKFPQKEEENHEA